MDRKADWFSWADKERLEPKRGKWRVVLIGESVARGYLYDPHYTPASVLEGMLKSHLGAEDVDVVDLAKSNLTIEQLKTLVGQSLALLPDLIVIFAGNNWRTHVTESDIPYVDSLLRKEGVPAMKAFLDTRREQAVRQLTSQVNSFLDANKVPVIWVVPEFNLDGWADPISNAPHLVGNGNSEWRALSEQAGHALRAHDLVLAESAAKRMASLDGGTNAVPLRILAECCRPNGDISGTRRYLELARDAEGWDPSFAYSPRVSSSIQIALREAASGPSKVVVDLPDVLSQHLDNALPDRRVFLDYCHLTAEGINVAMAAVASKVLALLMGEDILFQQIENSTLSLSAKLEGQVCFLAAVHNAHFYQGYDVVSYWCSRAIQFWPECAQIMTRFVDLQTRRVPIMACKSTLELFAMGESHALRYLLRGGKQRIDMVLGDAVVQCVNAIGLDIGKEVSDLRVQEHAIRTGPKELTDFYYSSAMIDPAERAWTSRSFSTNRGSHSIYASAFWETSKFIFFADKGQPVGLKFTYRVPTSSSSGGTVQIAVNGHRVEQAPVGRGWQTLEIAISSTYVVDGINEIVITWPKEGDSSQVELDRAADALLARRLPRFYRVFGEIHALTVFDPSGSGALHSGDLNSTIVSA
jgi:hypothetical protein